MKTLEQELRKLHTSQCKNIKELSWQTSQPLLSYPVSQNAFLLSIDSENSDSLYKMSQICKD